MELPCVGRECRAGRQEESRRRARVTAAVDGRIIPRVIVCKLGLLVLDKTPGDYNARGKRGPIGAGADSRTPVHMVHRSAYDWLPNTIEIPIH